MHDWIKQANNKSDSQTDILSFNDYMELTAKAPDTHLRTNCQYLLDMLASYGNNEQGESLLFQEEHKDAPAVYGHHAVQEELIKNLQNFKEEGFNNKFILLVGPNGSSKSSLVKKMVKGMELYSKKDEGALYTFSWIFPIDPFLKGSLGLANNEATRDINSFAYLEDKDISAILTSELKDHPLLLIPREYRQEIIDEKIGDDPSKKIDFSKNYLYNGDLSKRNNMIYDALLKSYKGRHEDVLKHIRVERFYISKRYSTGAVTIEPQMHVDAQMQQITMDKRLSSLPPSLQSLNLFSAKGQAIMANRGILEYSDLLKRPLDTYKYLLTTMETQNINLNGILTELDIFFIGTSNEVHLAAFKQHPDFNSFKGRMNFIRVPYLLDFQKERQIYLKQVEGLKDQCHLEPHALTALCLFAVLSRVRAPQVKNYSNKGLANIVTNLNPMEKVLFISKNVMPSRLTSEEKQLLEVNKDEILNEYKNDNLYEGKFGISPRSMKSILYDLCSERKSISFIDVVDYLEHFITLKNDFDFLNMAPQSDYHHPARFLSHIKGYCFDFIDKELRSSLGMVDERSYEEHIKRYVENIMALIRGEKVKNSITGKYEGVDTYRIEEFEKSINLKEKADDFRSSLLSKIGAYSLDNPGAAISYVDVLPELSSRLQESFRIEQKKVIEVIARNLVFYESELSDDDAINTPMSRENRQQIESVVENLCQKYQYSRNGAISLIKALIKERY
jgi:serine protein kinase